MTLTPFTISPPAKVGGEHIVNAPGLGKHFQDRRIESADVTIDGTFDSAVLIDGVAGGSSLRRYHITQGASIGVGPGYGRHGFYVKAPNVKLYDIWVQTDPNAENCDSCFSVRDAGFAVKRFHADGLFISTVYEHLLVPGTISFTYGKGNSFKDDTGNWIDTTLAHTISYSYCDFNGMGMFVKANLETFPGLVVLHHCTWNGKDVTRGMTNLPSSQITIL